MRVLLAVGLGSAIGGVSRYLIGGALQPRSPAAFPWGTLVVKVAGSFLAGVIARVAVLRPSLTPDVQLFLTAGFCGGFTTFSTRSLEAVTLVQGGHARRAVVYLALSAVCGVAAVAAGIALANTWRR